MTNRSQSSCLRDIDENYLAAIGGPGSENIRAVRKAELQAQFEGLFETMQLPPAARNYVLQTVVSLPTQTQVNTTDGTQIIFPSRKMALSFPLMSKSGEFAHVYCMEIHPDVLGYFMQSLGVSLEIKADDGRLLTRTMYTPDALVFTRKCIYVREFRDEKRLVERHIKNPYQYYQDELGLWRYRAAEEYFAAIGLKFEIVTNQSLPVTLIENMMFLEDYYRDDCERLDRVKAQQLVLSVQGHRYASLRTLIAEGHESDDIYKAAVAGLVYLDLERVRCDRPASVFVYPDRKTCDAHRALQRLDNSDAPPIAGVAEIAPGTKIRFHSGKEFIVVVPGERDVQVTDEDGVLSTVPLNTLLKNNNKNIELVSPPGGDASDAVSHLTTKEIEDAARRLVTIETKIADGTPLTRNERNYQRRFHGIPGRLNRALQCVDRNRAKGNRTARLPARTEQLAEEVIEKIYNAPEATTAIDAHKHYCGECEKESKTTGRAIPAMSYRSFLKRIATLEDVKVRKGKRKAYQTSPPIHSLQNAFPRHGSRPHEVLYIDSTIVTMQTLGPNGIPLGKFTMTLGVDGATHQARCLSFCYNKASAWTFFLAIRDYVKRHGRLPDRIHCDNGPEFKNRDVKLFCEVFGIKLVHRKPAEPRGGAMIESLIGVTQKMLIQTLKGNTVAVSEDARSVSPEVNGFNRGEYDLLELYKKMEHFLFKERNATPLATVGDSPDKLEEALKRELGARNVRAVAFNSDFMLLTSPHAEPWTRKYDLVKGVNVGGRYFRAPEMRTLNKGVRLEVREEGWLARVVYVLINKTWRIAVCNHPDLANHTRKEDELAAAALQRQGAAKRYKANRAGKTFEVPPEGLEHDEKERLRQEANLKVAAYQFGGIAQAVAMPEVAVLLEVPAVPIDDIALAAAVQASSAAAAAPADGIRNDEDYPAAPDSAQKKRPPPGDDILDGIPGYH